MNITVEGKSFKVVENLGFQHSIGLYARRVLIGDREKMVVRPHRGKWRFWTPEDRVAPLRAAMKGSQK